MIDVKQIPDALKEGENWPLLDLDPEWVWLAHSPDGSVCGLLIAAPCHGLVFIFRLRMLPSAPHGALLKLLRRFVRDLRRRHVLAYIACVDILNRPAEATLMRIAFRAGIAFSQATTMICGSLNTRHVGGE